MKKAFSFEKQNIVDKVTLGSIMGHAILACLEYYTTHDLGHRPGPHKYF